MKDKIFITGSSGYIGNHLVKFFLKKKFKVYGCDLNINRKDGNFLKTDFSSDRVVKFIKSKKIDNIIHLAALTEIKNNKRYSNNCKKTNFLKSKIFLKKIKKNKIFIKNFIFSSSAAVYGKTKNLRVKENHITKPISVYGSSKLNFEKYLIFKKQNYLNNIFICRFFNVIGGDLLKIKNKKSLFNYLNKSIKKKKVFYINGKNYNTPDGTTVRDFIDINILSKFILLLIKTKQFNQKKIFNVGSGFGTSILKILNELEMKNFKIKFSFRKRKRGDIPFSVSDNTQMMKKLNIKKENFKIINNIKKFFK